MKKSKTQRLRDLNAENGRLKIDVHGLEFRASETVNLVLAELEKHLPRGFDGPISDGSNPLHPGNYPSSVQLVCRECSTAWPCKQMNVLRRVYSTVNGYPVRPDLLPIQLSLRENGAKS